MTPTAGIGLCMLVRDEEENVQRAIEQTLTIVDHLTIVDTGSTDRTTDIVRDLLADVAGQLHEREWRGFGPNRTELLELAQGTADYHLMLDADHTLHVNGDQPNLDADCYLLPIRGQTEWRLPLLTRDGHPFEYRGAAHSYLHSDAPTREEPTDWLSIDGGPGASREKLERDRTLLEQAFLDDPHDSRTVFYLAETYRSLDEHQLAIRFYLMRADMEGFAEETYQARYQAGVLLGEHVGCFPAFEQLIAAYKSRRTRAEALRALANLANSIADKTPVPDDILFVRPDAYQREAA